MLKADAIFEGGGIKGIGLVGAVCCLEKHGYSWQKLAGTSAGSIIAALLAAGYSGEELKKILYTVNYSGFLKKDPIHSIPLIGETLNFILQKGIYRSDGFELWIAKLLEAKGKTKFKDVSINGVSNLKIIATDITTNAMLILPDDLVRYDIDPMEFEIAKAVKMSLSIPFYFKPVKLTAKDKTYFIVDGGVLSNFPVWIFDVKGTPRWPTFGFKLVEPNTSRTAAGKSNFISFTLDLIHTLLDSNELSCPVNKEFVRTISVPSMGVKTTEFSLKEDKCHLLFNSGYNAASGFMDTWNFKEYVQTYRNDSSMA